MALSAYEAKYFAHVLTQAGGTGVERLTQSLLSAAVDLNPHQIEAALFALHTPLSSGVLLADEVGLGKTIEAGLVMCQKWAERKRKLLVICPASLRKQWQCELEDKFNLPVQIIDAKSTHELKKKGFTNPYEARGILISSYPYAARNEVALRAVGWDCVVMDEAHKMRNSYRSSNKIGQALLRALEGRTKLLLTATPLQNNLTELYGLANLLDDKIFGDLPTFRTRYVNQGGDIDDLRRRLGDFCHRKLRKDVQAFVKYTDRIPMTEKFVASEREQSLYEDVSDYLRDEMSYAFPMKERHMLTLLVRKVLASSTFALIGTLQKILTRLEAMRDGAAKKEDEDLLSAIFKDDPDLIDLCSEENEDEQEALMARDGAEELIRPGAGESGDAGDEEVSIDLKRLGKEIEKVRGFILRARAIDTDTKARHLLKALDAGWEKLRELGANEKAVIFTESRRSMEFLREFLSGNGYEGQVICFSGGSKKDETSEAIYQEFRAAHPEDTTSKPIMMRHALIDAFKRKGKILIATEAGAEGINLQFCSMVVNYDLPWNPQRVEQRIGRCHRYGQKFDVVVINFCNVKNAADYRVFELLSEKFKLFSGIFGASNDVLGIIEEQGKSFEQRIHNILQLCRSEDEINAAFDKLQAELSEQIEAARSSTARAVLENFSVDVLTKLKVTPELCTVLKENLSTKEKRFREVTKYVLSGYARFEEGSARFVLERAPAADIPTGVYTFDYGDTEVGVMSYRPNSVLGEWVLQQAKGVGTPYAELTFDVTNFPLRQPILEKLKGESGYLCLEDVVFKSLDAEDYLLFSATKEDGRDLDAESAAELFTLGVSVGVAGVMPEGMAERLRKNAALYAEAKANEVGEANNAHFKEASLKLDHWCDDQVAAATTRVNTLQRRKKELQHHLRVARTLDEQGAIQEEMTALMKEIRKARAAVFDVEDEAEAKRDQLLAALKRKIVPSIERKKLFTIRWRVI